MSLLDFIRQLLSNAGLREDFAHDPQGTLAAHGLDTVTPQDVHDALILSEDDSQHGDFSRNYDLGHNSAGFTPPPPPVHHDYATPAASHEAAVQYLNNYITNNNYVTDNSINQQIDTHGGAFDQTIDEHNTTANGDGSVAVGGNVDHSPITTGNGNEIGNTNVHGSGNVVGNGNQAVTGEHDTTGFGSGAVTSTANSTTIGGNVTVDHGSAFGSGSGPVSVDNSNHSIDNSTHNWTDNSSHDYSIHNDNTWNDNHSTDSHSTDSHSTDDHSIEHSFNHDADVHAHLADHVMV